MTDQSQALTVPAEVAVTTIEQVLVQGDLAKLSVADRLAYYGRVCESLGLNPLTKPFEYIALNGRLTLYARKDATDQLRRIYCVSVEITGRDRLDDVYVVSIRARLPNGRTDESTGAVSIAGQRGDNLANAMMKAETKAKRRATLSICGLGMLDETELETIPEAASPGAASASASAPLPASSAPARTEMAARDAEARHSAYLATEALIDSINQQLGPGTIEHSRFDRWFAETLGECYDDTVGVTLQKQAQEMLANRRDGIIAERATANKASQPTKPTNGKQQKKGD